LALGCGIILTVVASVFGTARLIADNQLVPVDSDASVTVLLPSGQDLLYVALLGEDAPRPFGPSQVQIVDLATGTSIPTTYDRSLDHNSPDGVASLGLISFNIPSTAEYRVRIHGPRGLRIWAGTSPGTTVRHLIPWGATAGLGLLLLCLGVVGVVTRSRRRRAAIALSMAQ
jgi:hypothetical protein